MSTGETYTGVTITNGTLEVDSALAAGSTVNVSGNGSLTGSGTVPGTVNVLTGGHVNAFGFHRRRLLTLGKLVLNAGANSDFQLASSASANKLVNVTGNLKH